MSKKIILFLFVFFNYYNPISVYLTLILNILLILFILFLDGRTIIRFNRYIIVFTLFILIWAIFIMIVQSNINMYVLGKYLRVTASTLLIMVICSGLRVSSKQLIGVLQVIFFIHILSIGMQFAFPQLNIPMANLFGFERESTIISKMSTRNLGCTSSYDTASLISITSMVFFILLYVVRKKNKYLLLASLSLFSCTRTSRIGMALGALFFVVLIIFYYYKTKRKKRLASIFFLLCGIALIDKVILPIIVSSQNTFLSETNYSNANISTADYTTTTPGELISRHLSAMNAPILDLIVGFGIDPNRLAGRETDIGYVKMIYHIGIIGLILILFLYLYVFRKTIIIKKNSYKQSAEFILSSFLVLYVILLMVMNFKSLEMYSRGSHDLLLIIFCFLTNKYHSQSVTLSSGETY